MLTFEQKATIYSCIKKQFPDQGLYRISRISEWLFTNGISVEKLGYRSFVDFAKDFKEMFSFQDDGNDVFIKIGRWEEGERNMQNTVTEGHPADSFFGSTNIILNDDIIEMSQQSLYALTKILGNGFTVQEMKQAIYASFEEAKATNHLMFLGEKYTFPIDYCEDGFLVRGIVTKNISPRGKSLYFSFEKTQISRVGAPEPRKRPVVMQGSISEEDKQKIYKLITDNFPVEKPLHMAAISKLLTDNNIDRTKYGCYKMKELLSQLDFLELKDTVLGGVPQIMVTVHAMDNAPAEPAHSVGERPEHSGYERREYAPRTYDEPHFSKPAEERPTPVSFGGRVPEGSLDSFCTLPTKPIDIIRHYLSSRGVSEDVSEIRTQLCEDFDKARREGNIRFFEGKMIFPCRYEKEDGSPVEITLKPSTYEGRAWFLYYVDTAVRDRAQRAVHPGKQLENFAFLGSWSSFLTELAEKAVDEEWDFQNSPKKNYHILIQYIKYTFCRLLKEKKVCISMDKQFASFNTGLVDKHYDDIYACFVPNDSGSDTPWKFAGFCTAASGGLGKLVVNYFNPLPQPPRYFNRNEDLFFDLDKQLHPDFNHIIIDNIRRFPVAWLKEQFYDNAEGTAVFERLESAADRDTYLECYESLKGIIADNSRLFMRIKNRLTEAIELAKKRVRWNYKTAIPSYFPKRDTMSLMLPLCLCDDEKADIALVVELTQSGNYQGQTILTIPQAYIDARLMCRLTSDWLNPSDIRLNLNSRDEQDFAAADEELADID